MTYPELKERVLEGYTYTVGAPSTGERQVVVWTGSGGARTYIDACEEAGMPADLAAIDVYVNLEGHGAVSLSKLKVKGHEA